MVWRGEGEKSVCQKMVFLDETVGRGEPGREYGKRLHWVRR